MPGGLFQLFIPTCGGEIDVGKMPADFSRLVAERVKTGLLNPGERARANYRVVHLDDQAVVFEAQDFWTAFNIGLNRVRVYRVDGRRVGYAVEFWNWTFYVAALFAAIALLIAAAWLLVSGDDLQGTGGFIKGAVLVATIAFWGLASPWLLAAMHKPVVCKVLERILKETLAGGKGA
jgi:hypothetical protein